LNPLYDSENSTKDTKIIILDERIFDYLKSIESNTHPKHFSRWSRTVTMVYRILGITGMTIAMSLSGTMFYILWFGFYSPIGVQGIFFMDRLYDFRDLIQGLRNGTIMQSFTDALVRSMNESLEKYRGGMPGLPPYPGNVG
jgi:hypothetical protein